MNNLDEFLANRAMILRLILNKSALVADARLSDALAREGRYR
jgi:hypothetical protein